VIVTTAIVIAAVRCSAANDTSQSGASAAAASPTRPPPRSEPDWVNFVRFGGITYLAMNVDRVTPLEPDDLGPEFAKVAFKYAGNVFDPFYSSKNGKVGDAGFLDADLPMFTVKGYKPEFMLAAHFDGQLVPYVANTSPNAKTGSDLMDIGDKVESTGVTDTAKNLLVTVTKPAEIKAVVESILSAPVNQEIRRVGDPAVFLIISHLKDGMSLTRAYFPESGELSSGIFVSDEFQDTIGKLIP
jgi:hypothetical protein